MAFKLVTGPAAQVVTTAQQKTFMRITVSDDDTLIDTFIKSATRLLEQYLNRRFINQDWDLFLDGFPRQRSEPWWDGVRQGRVQTFLGFEDFLSLPVGPVSSVTHIKTYSPADVATTFSSSKYFLDDQSSPPRIFLNTGNVWPTDLRAHNAVEVQAVYGYGSAGTSVPDDIVLAVKMVASKIYEKRGECDNDTLLSTTVKSLTNLYKIFLNSDAQL